MAVLPWLVAIVTFQPLGAEPRCVPLTSPCQTGLGVTCTRSKRPHRPTYEAKPLFYIQSPGSPQLVPNTNSFTGRRLRGCPSRACSSWAPVPGAAR